MDRKRNKKTTTHQVKPKKQYAFYSRDQDARDGTCIYIIDGKETHVSEVTISGKSYWKDAVFLGMVSDDDYVTGSKTYGGFLP